MPDSRPLDRIAHVITSLETGGTQHSLLRVLSRISPTCWDSRVMSVRPGGPVGPKLQRIGVDVSCLNIEGVLGGAVGLLELRRYLDSLKPVIVQGWMYHGNLAATLAARDRALVWNIRNSLHERPDKWTTRLVVYIGARLSRHPRRIVYNSLTCARQHEACGYSPAKTVIIPNGFDLSTWCPQPSGGRQLRQSLTIPAQARVVGMVARNHPVKNYEGFIELASRLRSSHPDLRFLCAGEGVRRENATLAPRIRESGLGDAIHLLGEQEDLRPVYAAMDVLVLPSLTEAFPNVVGEAMACEVPCVVTDVGDCRTLVGDSGLVAEAGEIGALTRATSTLLSLGPETRANWGKAARARIRSLYSVEREVESYLDLYRAVAVAPRDFEN